MWFLFRRDITVSAPADTRPLPVWELLQEAWAYLRTALDVGDTAGEALWLEAFDALLDRLLRERPELEDRAS
jgi:hypothetical protein